ncbi:Putative vesicular-fusion protein sec17-like protein [Verticillium dahliae VDG1]|nr:Putative vesicular-fusion protein sec17-like protein [Verticillium dahliae VDG1]
MKCFDNDSSAFITSSSSYLNNSYSSSLDSACSASSARAWSAASSQSSTDTSPNTSSDSDSCDAYPSTRRSVACDQAPPAIPAELRQNPRRSNGSGSRAPPALVRQSDRKVNFVDTLVDSSTQIVEAIWPLSSVICHNDIGGKAVLPLRTFIQETLRRSRPSYSTLQVALYYLILIKPHVPKHDFTMEQPDDRHECRALQCGRRMFLAALILASKYLQDRNYSARAWSKISGLATNEINQNELAFIFAVNWELHITDDVFQRWTDIVLKYTPPSPPPPGSPSGPLYAQQSANWKKHAAPSGCNMPSTPCDAPIQSQSATSSADATPTPRSYVAPHTMEPVPASTYTPGRYVPALGLLPTPRMTPQLTGQSTPAVSAASCLLGRGSAMGLAMAQASNACAAQNLDRWQVPVTSSPHVAFPVRRTSLATSVSTASSPESMVSDSSRASRSSSISSASSLASAPAQKMGVSARFRSAKLSCERLSSRPAITSVPEDFEDNYLPSSQESYNGPVGKLEGMALEAMSCSSENDAARALQALQGYQYPVVATPTGCLSRKRSRDLLEKSSLQENVREMLARSELTWSNSLNRSHTDVVLEASAERGSPRKRVCCATEAARSSVATNSHFALGGYRGPGMWEGILN